jgi:hypothetical protein
MRALIRAFDALLRRASGVFEYTDRPGCLLRLQHGHTKRALHLPGGDVPAGAPVLHIHLWNEHVPPIPASGPDLAWAARTYRLFVGSLREVARLLASDPAYADAQAIGGASVLIPLPGETATGGFVRRLGFTTSAYGGALGRFGEFWENLYTWAIMWAYNMPSLHGKNLLRLHRQEMWMSRAEFLRRFGGTPSPPAPLPEGEG